jgi:hypothetical protein
VFQQYGSYVAQQLLFIWMPSIDPVATVSGRLANVTFSPLATFLPEYWYFRPVTSG